MGSLHQDFKEPGRSADPEATFRWLDRAAENPLIQGLRQRMFDTCPVGAQDQVLDVGCGLGHEVRRLGQLVGPRGREVTAWWATLEQAAEAETFFSAVLGFIVAGYKPQRPDN